MTHFFFVYLEEKHHVTWSVNLITTTFSDNKHFDKHSLITNYSYCYLIYKYQSSKFWSCEISKWRMDIKKKLNRGKEKKKLKIKKIIRDGREKKDVWSMITMIRQTKFFRPQSRSNLVCPVHHWVNLEDGHWPYWNW